MNSGTDSQVFAITIPANAPFGAESQGIGDAMIPTFTSRALITPCWALNIYIHKNAVTVLGNTQGSSEADRTNVRPANG